MRPGLGSADNPCLGGLGGGWRLEGLAGAHLGLRSAESLDAWSSLAYSSVQGYMGVSVDQSRAGQNLFLRDDFLAIV